MTAQITIRGARLHNLKNISLSIPKNQLVVLTGVSGSGKSTLGLDILFKEGQRQYLESFGLITYGVSKPPVDAITGLSPTISVDQHLTNHSPRSTVGTATEVYTYLRVLYARLGHRPCPTCGKDISPSFDSSDAEWAGEAGVDEDDSAPEGTFPCPQCGAPIPELGMAHFSFNKPDGACPTCTGLGVVHHANLKRLIDETRSIRDGAVLGWDDFQTDFHIPVLQTGAAYYGFAFDPAQPVREFNPPLRDYFLYGVESPIFRRHFPGIEPPPTVRQGRFEGIATNLLRRYAEHIQDPDYREKVEELLIIQECPDCHGTRLRPESRAVTVNGANIVELSRRSLGEIDDWLAGLPAVFTPDEMLIASSILADLKERIARLVEVGAGYLTLDRSSPTLSAGEAQRLRLAALLGSGLSGLLYVFDEPTIGLHQRDTRRMIDVMRRLRDLGNTVLVIEHDLETIAAADYVIDFGPGAGKNGGQVVAAGTPAEVAACPESLTGQYLAGRISIPVPPRRRQPNGRAITIRGARQHNLQNITVRLPLGLLIAVTGVSGSGKSSLVFDVLDRALRQRFYGAGGDAPGEHDSIDGCEYLDKVVTIDQEPIGRIPRSNAATYSDTFSAIRAAFAAEPEARRLGLTARHFSFNVPGGRCERCEGAGVLTVKMHFLPDVEVRCPACHGRRFTRETLSVRYRGRDISEALEMTVEEALALFQNVPAARSRLQVLADVGLGYLQLGQPATTLSGGEAQRVKLAKELGRRGTGRTLYLLDEPTTGLHLADIARLLGVLQRLVDSGNTVLVVEHNLELVKTADWVIDLGPEGGAAGGRLIAEGTPEQVAQTSGSYTGRYLKELL
ncbi:excinuclease ABC, A subunit [Longilinea arvoryzae]|uniref:UvrABC system protein A n=1 Tax=Longilinea arvoryzae TaxID=360412 RepID=A0A0S7BEI3_9CHLR|nr:excinuclease ABC subunit UvrA [Longilinea arvoryzae]GAP12915.1 excinuclease ABC, A subunit [Longilinea arvoryzae]